MASSSSHRQNIDHDAFSGISPPSKRRRMCGSSKLYDVFINHRGPDVKETLAKDLYKSLHELQLSVFLDSEELELGDVFPSNIQTAICSSSVHIAIFSRGYADSAWCLAELTFMLETDAKIIPVFYDVAPSDLRFIDKGFYAQAFSNYEGKGRYLDKLERWKESLQSVSVITGYECSKHNNDDEEVCQRIVRTVLKEVQVKKPLHVAEHSVGLNKLIRDLEIFCKLNERKGDNFNIIGIYGMGGVGKTTLAKELFNNKCSQYDGACFLSDVREAYAKSVLPSLQSKLIQDLVHESNVKFHSIDDGISHLKHRLGNTCLLRFLIVLDDIDNMEQLDALLIKGKQNLVIVTTRDEGVLINARINLRFKLKGMNEHDGREIFCQHAFNQPRPFSGYEDLVDAFVKACRGLPLSLKVFGRHVSGRSQDYWLLELDKIRRVLPGDVLRNLKISFDSLDHEEKQIFMDIACFFNDKCKSVAIEIWKISRWSGEHALQRLKEKCLVEEIILTVDGVLKMHDHLRDLGRQMAEELTPVRVWRPDYLQSLESKGFQKTLALINARCFHSMRDRLMDAQITFFIGNSDYCSQASSSLLWLELMLNGNEHTCIPSWVPLQNLQGLKVSYGWLKRLWENNVQAPSQLKVLEISKTFLKEFPDLSGMSNQLERVQLKDELSISIQGCSLLKSLKPRSFVLNSGSTLHTNGELAFNDRVLEATCFTSSYFPNLLLFYNFKLGGTLALKKERQSRIDFTRFVKLNISKGHEFEELCLEGLHGLEKIRLDRCEKLKCLKLSSCKKLTELVISQCRQLKKLCLESLYCVETITVDNCENLNCLELNGCKKLKTVSGISYLNSLVILDCCGRPELEDFLHQQLVRSPPTITTDDICETSWETNHSEVEDCYWPLLEAPWKTNHSEVEDCYWPMPEAPSKTNHSE
ncbi:hypothetical protein KI387_034147, partial [Taxus chinensis]